MKLTFCLTLSLFLTSTTAPAALAAKESSSSSSYVHGRGIRGAANVPPPPDRSRPRDTPTEGLVEKFQQRRRPPLPESESNTEFQTSRLSPVEMKVRAQDMKHQLEMVERGTLTLSPKTINRYQAFLSRYAEREKEFSKSVNVPPRGPLEKKPSIHAMEFMETRDMFVAKTEEERESAAEHVRKEVADHEAGLHLIQDESLYKVKKNALNRYDRIHHKKEDEEGKRRNEQKESKVEKENDVDTVSKKIVIHDASSMEAMSSTGEVDESSHEETVSKGKTIKSVDPETLEAPPRSINSSEEKEMYRKHYANVEVSTGV